MTLHNTPARLNVATLIDDRPRERFVNAAHGRTSEAGNLAQAMVVMEVWEAARGPEPAAVVAQTLPVDQGGVGYYLSLGAAWLWEPVVNPTVSVLAGDGRYELAEVLEGEDNRSLHLLADRLRHQRIGGGQYMALTLKEVHTIRPIVAAIPEAYAERDRLLPLVREAWRDAASEQRRRFRADLTDMGMSAGPRAWADLYGYQRACTVLEWMLGDGAPYLGDGSETVTSVNRLEELYQQVTAKEREGRSHEEIDFHDGWVMSREDREALRTRPGTWRWGQANT